MKQTVISFVKGMNTDLENSMVSQGMYKSATNLRLGNQVSTSSGNIGALENVQGNKLVANNELISGTILGQVNVRDYIVLFVKHDTHDAIYRLLLNFAGDSITEFEIVYSDLESTSKLNFNLNNKIIAIGRHETSELSKVYWVDGLNPIRYMDLNKDYLTVPIEASIFEIVPPYNLSAPVAAEIIEGGNYTSGVVQYSYQLYTKNGANTAYSPLSNLVKLAEASQFVEGGSEKGDSVNKSVRVTIPSYGYDSRYERIRIVAVHYNALNSIPTINVVGEYLNTQNFSFIDTCNILNTLTLEEFTSFAEALYVPKTIESKNNYLFAANIEEVTFNSVAIDNWDARAYRFKSSNYSRIKLSDLIIVNGEYVLFNKPLVIRSVPMSGITSASEWQDLWFYDGNKIYIVVPIDLSNGAVPNIINTNIVSAVPVQNVFTYNEFTELLSFGNRKIASVGDITESASFLFPVSWNKIYWNSETGAESEAVCRLFTTSGAMHLLTQEDIVEDPVNWNVPITHDAINYYNKLEPVFGPNAEDEIYNRQSDGYIVGGEGPNIKYVIDFTTQEEIDGDTTDPIKSHINKTSLIESSVGVQAGEVYRIGIGFYNSYGQCSFIKWTGDIKITESSEFFGGGFTLHSDLPGFTFLNSVKLNLRVTIKNFPEDEDIQGWQIFRVDRTKVDRSVLYSGLLSPTVHRRHGFMNSEMEPFSRPASLVSSDTVHYSMYPIAAGTKTFSPGSNYTFVPGSHSDRTIEFHCPELNFFDPSIGLAGLKLKVGYLMSEMSSEIHMSGDQCVASYKFGHTERLNWNRVSTPEEYQNHFPLTYDILNYAAVSPVPEASKEVTTVAEDFQYKNQMFVIGKDTLFSTSGSGVVFYLDKGIYSYLESQTEPGSYYGVASSKNEYLYGRIVRDVRATRYGGESYTARNNNEYIPYSLYIPKSTSVMSCYYGDTYITMFQYMRGQWADTIVGDIMSSKQESIIFPCESSIDLRYRLDQIFKYISNGVGWIIENHILNAMAVQETVEQGVRLQPDTYEVAIGDLYRYNTVYSTSSTVKKYYQKPFDFENVSSNDVKIIVSEKKFNGEYIDNWTVFKPANFIEVDTKYGPVNVLKNFNGNLLFWQDKAFGALGVNERSLIADNNPGQLSLGTGGVLERYDYSSTEIGCTNHFSLSNSDSALYWYDKINHQLLELSDRVKYLDLEKGIKSYVRNMAPSDDVLVETDKYNREIIFSFPGNNVLIYGQLIEAFVGNFSYEPYMLFRDYEDRLFTIPNDNKYSIYKHSANDVTRGTFYNSTTDSEITLLFNEDFDSVKAVDSISFPSKSLQGNVDIFDDTFDTFQAYNSYQNTGEYTLIKGGERSDTVLPIERRERMWTTFIPRNAVNVGVSSNPDILNSATLDKTLLFKDRMRDNYLIIKLKYDNSIGNYFSVPYVKILYRNSTR